MNLTAHVADVYVAVVREQPQLPEFPPWSLQPTGNSSKLKSLIENFLKGCTPGHLDRPNFIQPFETKEL